MRLFFALALPEDWKRGLDRAAGYLRAHAHGCTPTRRENFHLTLVFLGETGRPGDAAAALGRVRCAPFSLTTGHPGRFRGRGGDTWWLGVEPCPPLLELHGQLTAALEEAGFSPERRPYRPHLTLARRVRPGPGFDPAALEALTPPMTCPVTAVTLFRSHREAGVLRYTPLRTAPLDFTRA